MASPSPSPFPSLPVSQVTIPSTPLIAAALAYTKEHCNETTVNHVLRSTAFALLLARKLPPLASIDTEAVVLSTLLHDMGWATTKALNSPDKRFEVDGANIARNFIAGQSLAEWDPHRLQLLWDAVALHTTPSIALYKQPEVVAVQLGITVDFLGPNVPVPGSPVSVAEYQEIVGAFPRVGFGDFLVELMCGFCREKPETAFGSLPAEFGKLYGLDGKGEGREEFEKQCDEHSAARLLLGGLQACEQWEK